MRRTLGILAVLLGLVFSSAATCSVGPGARVPHTHDLRPAPIEISEDANTIVTLVNEQRVAAGCDELVVDGSMVAFAQEQSNFMDNGGGLTHSRLGAPIFAENLSQGYTDPQAIVDAWLDSAVHKRNMLDCSYTATGAAITGEFAAQVFGDAA